VSGFGGVPFKLEACKAHTAIGTVEIPAGVAFVLGQLPEDLDEVDIFFSVSHKSFHIPRPEWDRLLSIGLAHSI
jgi:hypothetical protein